MQNAQSISRIHLTDLIKHREDLLAAVDASDDTPDVSSEPDYLIVKNGMETQPDGPFRTGYNALSICIAGRSRKIINDRQVEIRPQTLQFITPHHTQSIVDKSSDFETTELLFGKEFLKEAHIPEETLQKLLWIDPRYPPCFRLTGAHFKEVKQLFNKIKRESKDKKNFHRQIVRHLIIELLFRINRIEKGCLHDGAEPNSQGYRIFREFKNKVETHFKKKKTVQEYADLLNVTPKYLSEIVKKESGKTALQYIHQRIVTEAKNLLGFTNKTSKEIAYTLGFNNPSQFSRFFKRETGKTPTRYRKNRSIEH